MAEKKERRAGRSGARQAAVVGSALAATVAVAGASWWAGAGAAVLGLHAVAIGGAVAAWLRADAARRAAEKVSSDLDFVANRLILLDHRLLQQGQAVDPKLRSTVDEVTGEIGVLGGILRELAETVAAHDHDVADLKEHLRTPPVPAARPPQVKAQPPAPQPQAVQSQSQPVFPQPQPAAVGLRPGLVARADLPAPAPRRVEPAQPEPSLLPASRKEPAIPDAEARRMAAILQAFEADRIELHLQPVVSLPQRKVRFYEALARLRLADESILVPAEFLPLLERLGHAAEFDRRVLGRALAITRHLMARGSEAVVSINIAPKSMDEPGFLRSLARVFDAYPDTIGRIVLELSQRCWRTLDAERAGALAVLRDKGIPLALDRASDLRLDPLSLADRGVRFVKLPADLLIAADHGRGLDIEAADLASVLRRAGIKLVAERVEREESVPDLLDLDVPLAQGFVFAAPRAVRSEVLAAPPQAEAEPSAPPATEPAPPAAGSAPQSQGAPQPERLPFRAFLRRAG
ncbi:MAG TPA: EAL domain-containing protein [Microvirga sp.]|jgi:cyclic-di-GMP phosphodiesterase TipF (flagellum assembly factor)|nr:EAL domain-containing protein [Microvirga sp.]